MTTITHPTETAAVTTRWITWLCLWIYGVIAFSALGLVWEGISGDLFTWVVFGETATPAAFSAEAVDYQRLIFTIVCAVTIGWMLLLLAVVRTPLRGGERWAWTAAVTSVATWYVVDSTFSIALGYPENAVLNSLFVAGFVPPLVALRSAP